MITKDGVQLAGLHPRVMLRLPDIESVTKFIFTREAVITSALDGQHMEGSLHSRGRALDLRINDQPQPKILGYFQMMKQRLGKDWDVVLENDHLHIEWDPKRGN